MMAISEEDQIPEILRRAREVPDCPEESRWEKRYKPLRELLDIGRLIDPNFKLPDDVIGNRSTL